MRIYVFKSETTEKLRAFAGDLQAYLISKSK